MAFASTRGLSRQAQKCHARRCCPALNSARIFQQWSPTLLLILALLVVLVAVVVASLGT